ncbi:Response regulator receiver [gamma proteobacterium HdN1]|nr:Response regulator receiver [gamma proteobacterium HdN1]
MLRQQMDSEHLIAHEHSIAHFFMEPPAGLELVEGYYQPSLVMLSVAVAVSLSWLSLVMANTAQRSSDAYRQVTIATGAFALGSGIWTMHFIGMFAYHLPAPVRYHGGLTAASMLPALAAAWVTLSILTKPDITKARLLLGGVLMGAGIGTMHYGGMMAIETPLVMRHDPLMFAVSIVVAVVLAVLAIGIRFGLQSLQFNRRARFWLSGAIMGCAIAGMHYTAMQAVHFYGEPTKENSGLYISAFLVALAIASIAITVAMTVGALNSLFHSRELNREIQAARQRLEAVFSTTVDAMITITPKGMVQEFSPSATRLFGYLAQEVVGQNVKMLMPEPYRTEHDGYLQRYMTTRERRVIGIGREVVGLRKDGSIFPMRLAVGQADLSSGETLFVGMVSDLSQRKAMEDSLREAAEHAERAAAAKTRFLGNMSHEIRTPMNAIIGFTDVLLQTELTPKQRGYLTTVSQSSRTLLALLNDILDVTKLDSGKVVLESTDFSLRAVSELVDATLRVSAERKGLVFSCVYPDQVPEFFKGDSLRIGQVLTNLVGNAIKFTESGEVRLLFGYESGQVHIQVSDTGIGMSQAQAATIFDPFTQADASISRRFGGTGLGTTISRQLVDVMGGRIEVESELGKGSIFHVWLPLAVGSKPDVAHEVAPVSRAQQLKGLPSLHILIADDVEQNLELLTLVLEGKGHTVVKARNGNQALNAYIDGTFDVVLMDVHMPEVDGLQAARSIRDYEKHKGRPHTPIVALTASVMESDRRQTEQAGMDGFAGKPLDPPALFAEIARLLGYQRGAPRALPKVENGTAIDWVRGVSLWGDQTRLTGKIHDFFAKNHQLAWSALDQDALVFALHGIKGVAGNLGLMPLSRWAGALEQKGRGGETLDASVIAREAAHYFEAIQKELRSTGDSAGTEGARSTVDATSEARGVGAGVNLSELLTQLHATVEDNRLDDRLLESLSAAAQTKAGAIRAALEEFDFSQALILIEQWQAELVAKN